MGSCHSGEAMKMVAAVGNAFGQRMHSRQQPLSSFAQFIVESLNKSTSSIVENFRALLLNVSPRPGIETATVSDSRNVSVHNTHEGMKKDGMEEKNASVKEAFPGVFFILERFPAGNHAASLQSLAEIGALFPDVATLSRFQTSEIERIHVVKNIQQQHLVDIQLRLIHQLSPLTALNAYKAFAALRLASVSEVHEALYTTIASNIDSLELPDMVSLIQARLMIQPISKMGELDGLASIVSSTLDRSKKRNVKEAACVVHLLHLLVQYDLRNAKVLVAISDYLKARVKGLSQNGLVSVVAALKRLEHYDERLNDAIVVEVLQRGTDAFCLKELSKLAAVLTEIKHFDVMTDVLMDSIALSCQKRMEQLRFEELVDLLWAYAHHMHFHHDAKLLACLSDGLVTRLDSIQDMSAGICVKLCEAVSACDLDPDSCCRILSAVAEHVPASMSSMHTAELLAIATGCWKARYICDRLLEALRDAFEEKSDDLTSSDICRVLNNFASLNFYPGEKLMDLALLKAGAEIDLNSTEVSRLTWSLTFFNKLTIANSKPLFRRLESFSRSNFTALEIQKLLMSEKLILLLPSDGEQTETPMGLIPEPLRTELATTWKERIQFTRSISPFQQEISRMLNKLNIFHEAEAIIDNGDLSVDFLLFLGSDRLQDTEGGTESGTTVVLECDGSRRLSVNAPHRPLGQTLTFKKLLKAQGWKVHVISKTDWYKKCTDEQESLLKRTLKLQS